MSAPARSRQLRATEALLQEYVAELALAPPAQGEPVTIEDGALRRRPLERSTRCSSRVRLRKPISRLGSTGASGPAGR